MSHNSEHLGATIFVPHGRLASLSEYLDCTPHYLFRTTSPRSRGINTRTRFSSDAANYGSDQSDILGRDWNEAVRMLRGHLSWYRFKYDNLVSWTNSFLFAVQHAIRREKTDDPTSLPGEIFISVLDTRRLPQGTFLPAVALLQAYEIESKDKLKHKYYYGEYIAQGTIANDEISTTTLENLITNGLYKLYPPLGEVEGRDQLYRRIVQFRRAFLEKPEEPTDEEIQIAEKIAVRCFRPTDIRSAIMMTLLSFKPRHQSEFKILKAFKKNDWGSSLSSDDLESYKSISEHVPEHKQFSEMMSDVYEHTQCEIQEADTTHRATDTMEEIFEITENLAQLELTEHPIKKGPVSNTMTTSEQKDDECVHQKNIQNINTDTIIMKTLPSSPKTRMIEMMEEEREEQETALNQILDRYEETRPCPECAGRISETCFRNQHFGWCTTHELMIGQNDTCPQSPSKDAPLQIARCTTVYCDQTEEEAYWFEVEMNAIVGGAGFREPGEHCSYS